VNLPLAPPIRVARPRWEHQQRAFEFVERLWKTGLHGAMLPMWMGTGKTRVAIDLMTAFGLRIVLVLCPLRVVPVWAQQVSEYADGYECLMLDDRAGTIETRTRRAKDAVTWATTRNQKLVIIINYESARSDPFATWALHNIWPLVICDESHRLRLASGLTSRFTARLGMRTRYRLALTGTPMAHEPLDIWGQFRFLDPNVLDPTFGSFKLRHAVMGGYYDREIKGWKDLDQLNRKFYSIAFRVTEDVLDLPPELDEPCYGELSQRAQKIYDDMEEDLLAWVAEDREVTAANALVRLLRLQQITSGVITDDAGEEHQIDRTKEDLLSDLLSDIDPGEPVVVFARFKADLKAIHRACSQLGRPSAELSGTTDELELWKQGGADGPTILAVQIQAGGVGVDLTRARYAVYYSTGFSLTDYLQSRARVRRPPQTRPVTYYHLLIRGSIDEIVRRAIERRQDLIESTLSEIKKSQLGGRVAETRS